MEIIPAIDLIGGKCVRLTRGDFSTKKEYHSDPLEVARQFETSGIRRLHLVDLDGARLGRVVHYSVLESIATRTSLSIDFGGGIKTNEEIARVFDAGACYATIGSMAVKNRGKFLDWIRKYDAGKIILCADVVSEMVVIDGWLTGTGISIIGFLQEQVESGITQVICTDVSKDGLLTGPSFSLYEKILSAFPELQLVASGGVSDISDLLTLKESGLAGVIIGKAIYEGRISLKDLKILMESC